MKNTILTVAVIVLTLIANLANASVVLTGDTQTSFGKYQVSSSQSSVVINNVAYKTWELTYSGNSQKYIMFCEQGQDGDCCFTVRNENFEIQYAFCDGKFGAKLVDSAMRTIRKKDVMKQINYDKFLSQSVLTSTPKTQEEYLGLIACFMPLLFS